MRHLELFLNKMLVRQKKRYLISAFIFLFLLLGTGVGFVLLKNSQDVRQQASGGCKAGEPYCSCNLNGQDCVLVDPDGPRKIVDQGSAAGKRVGRIVTITDDLSEVSGTVSSQEQGGDVASADFSAAAPERIEVAKIVSVTYEIW